MSIFFKKTKLIYISKVLKVSKLFLINNLEWLNHWAITDITIIFDNAIIALQSIHLC